MGDLDFETDSQGIEIIKDIGANIYLGMNLLVKAFITILIPLEIAASDTTSAALETFILAMTSFPEIQKKAQEELDRVLRGRLPTHADITSLPYVSAIVKEVIRYVTSEFPLFQTLDVVSLSQLETNCSAGWVCFCCLFL